MAKLNSKVFFASWDTRNFTIQARNPDYSGQKKGISLFGLFKSDDGKKYKSYIS